MPVFFSRYTNEIPKTGVVMKGGSERRISDNRSSIDLRELTKEDLPTQCNYILYYIYLLVAFLSHFLPHALFLHLKKRMAGVYFFVRHKRGVPDTA